MHPFQRKEFEQSSMAAETVLKETPASFATSFMVAILVLLPNPLLGPLCPLGADLANCGTIADPFDQELTPNLSSRVGSYRPDRLRIFPEHCDCKWKTDPPFPARR
jgi:hypothetical protein